MEHRCTQLDELDKDAEGISYCPFCGKELAKQGQLGSKPVHAAAAPAQPMQPVQPMQQQFGGMPAPQQAAPSIYDDDIPF